MSRHLVEWLLRNPIDLPEVENVGTDRAWRVLIGLADYADETTGRMWASDRTQERHTGLERRGVIQPVRKALEREGWLVDTGKRGARGVKLYELRIPNYERPIASGEGDLATENVDKSVSGVASGEASGVGSGEGDHAQTEQNRKTPLPPNTDPRSEQTKTQRGVGKEWGQEHDELLARVLDREDYRNDRGGLRAHYAKGYRAIVATAISQGIEGDRVAWCLAQRSGASPTPSRLLPDPPTGKPDCPYGCDRGIHWLRDEAGIATSRKCHCEGGTYPPQEATQDTTTKRVVADLGANTHIPSGGGSADTQSDLVRQLSHKLRRVV